MHIVAQQMSLNATSLYARKEEEELKISSPAPSRTAKSEEKSAEDNPLEGIDPKYRIMALLLEALTGEKITQAAFRPASSEPFAPSAPASSSPVLEYRYQMEEHSRMDFSAEGSVRLEDGTLRTFSLSIQWEQHFSESLNLRMQDGKVMTDPLVISFDGTQPLSANAFAFNLTGKEGESLPYLSGRAGYLARDIDGDGEISGGSELFGPRSGEGFMELSALDSDRNGWIDSADSAFKQLRVWVVTDHADDLLTLEEAGIGAISLQTVALDYTAKSGAASPIADYKEASVALGEKEGVYGIFEVDVAV
jgi:hypothetical protein